MRKHVVIGTVVLSEVALAATAAGNETVCGQLDRVTYLVTQTNSAGFTGELVIERQDETSDTWHQLPITTMALAADDEIIVIIEPNFRKIRPRIIVAAGTADIRIVVTAKTLGA